MTNRKAIRRARRIRRTVLTVCLMALVAVLSIGGTIAWLTAKTGPITNTFTVGDIGLTLVEHKYNPDDTDAILTDDEDNAVPVDNNAQSYQMIPGTTYAKDPKVTITGNVDAYLFVKAEEVNTPGTYLTYSYTMDTTKNGWTKGTGDSGNGVPTNVWFRSVAATEMSGEGASWNLLTDDKVKVKDTIVDDGSTGTTQMPAATSQPQLIFSAYAVQSASITDRNNDGKIDAADAWKLTSQN